MGLKLYNARQKGDNITGLFLTPMAELKTCAVAIGGGGMAGNMIFSLFNSLAMPAVMAFGAAAVAFLSLVDIISDKMVQRSLERGEVEARTYRRPKIDV